MTRMESSPATVPRIDGHSAWSIAEARYCAAPGGVVKFWVATQEGQGAFVEVGVPQPTPGPRPEWCPPPSSGPRAHVLQPASAPAVPGFMPALVLNAGTDAVAVGLESDLPTLVGFDPSRPGVRWKQPVTLDAEGVRKAPPLGADLVAGTLYVPYQAGVGRRERSSRPSLAASAMSRASAASAVKAAGPCCRAPS